MGHVPCHTDQKMVTINKDYCATTECLKRRDLGGNMATEFGDRRSAYSSRLIDFPNRP